MRSLRRSLTLSHALVVLLAVLLAGLLSGFLVNQGFQQLERLQAQRDAEQIAAVLASAVAPAEADPLELLRRRLASPTGPPLLRNAPFLLVNPGRRVVFDRAGELEGELLPLPLRRATAPIVVGGATVGYVALPVERRALNVVERNVIGRVYLGVLCASLLAGTVAILVGLAISRRLTRPLRALTAAAQKLPGQERFEPLALETQGELGELARAFDAMGRELEHQRTLRRNLVADVAHELRTPLSVLRLQVEALQDGLAPPNEATFASLAEEVRLLSHLVEDLRLLSLADAGQLAVAAEALEPVLAVQRALALALPRARAKEIALRAEIAEPLPLALGDLERLVQVLGGLLDNALRYTPAGGSVLLRVERSPRLGGCVLFMVRDSGPGIAPEDLARIFERFYRADGARARETGGSGLGLAIAQRLVVAMGGQIWAESAPGCGASLLVALPKISS